MTVTAIAAELCPEQFGVAQLQDLAKIEPALIRAAPLNPVLRELIARLAQIDACEISVNHFAAAMGLSDDIVQQKNDELNSTLVQRFGNRLHPELCGSVVFAAPSAVDKEYAAFREFRKHVDMAFIKFTSDVYGRTDNLVQRFMPDGKWLAAPSTEHLRETIKSFELTLVEEFKKLGETESSRDAADRLIERARCEAILPRVTPPNDAALANYKSALETYRLFNAFLESDFMR